MSDRVTAVSHLIGAFRLHPGRPPVAEIDAGQPKGLLPDACVQVAGVQTAQRYRCAARGVDLGAAAHHRRGARSLALAGFWPPTGLDVDACLDTLLDERGPLDWRRLPDGHMVLAAIDADHGRRRLSLLRGLSGGERLYYVQVDGVLLFASSLRALLAHPRIDARLDRACLRDLLMTGLPLGPHSLVSGIREVRAGCVLQVCDGQLSERWAYAGLLDPPHGEAGALAGQFRCALAASVEEAIGTTRPVAVTLSGGIDSSAVAAAAVECFGADQVHAYTYEFDDPGHGRETVFARAVCRALGIRHHHVFRIRLDDWLARIPEAVWRAESLACWPKAFMLIASERIRDDGFDRQLSGFGIGSHMDHFALFGAWLDGAGSRRLLRALWRAGHSRAGRGLRLAERLHPLLGIPNQRVRYMLLRLLAARAQGSAPELGYGGRERRLLQALPAPHPLADALHDDAGSLGEHLYRHAFAQLMSCIDVTRWERPLRELGCRRMSPAHLARTLPYAYLPYRPGPRPWQAERALRPGKHLLRLAYAGVLPDAVLLRRKSWADAVASPRWLAAGSRWMRAAVPRLPADLDGGDADVARLLQRWDQRAPQRTVTALAFLHRLLLARPALAGVPGWAELLAERVPRSPQRPPALASAASVPVISS